MTVTTDHDEIAARLDVLLAADPVRGTVLGTVRRDLHETAWCALSGDSAAVAVRSSAEFPVVAAGPWDGSELAELVAVLDALPGLAGLSGPAGLIAALVKALGERRARPVAVRSEQRLFRLDRLIPPAVAGRARTAVAADRDLVAAWYAAFVAEAAPFAAHQNDPAARAIADGCWLWLDADDRPVSMAVRRPVVAGSARIGPVYTPPEARGHGYGSAATAAATADVLADGAVPVLFTDLDNPVSNSIYPRLGYRPVEDYTVIRYSSAGSTG